MSKKEIIHQLTRIADSLERLSPPNPVEPDLEKGTAFIWHAETNTLPPVAAVNHVDMGMLKGIDQVRDILLDNTLRFAKGYPANNALLWGARGMGKSSLLKAPHAFVTRELDNALALVEIHREDTPSLPNLMPTLQKTDRNVGFVL